MGKLLLDTDVLIDHLRGHRQLVADDAAISVVTRAELFAGDERQEPAIGALLADYDEVGVDTRIARRAGRVKRQTGLKIADALIAATALEHELPLMTRNRRHFEHVAGLVLHTP
ncbi:MAG TPA: type II toxin-antitoxin system VapC family toxin [Solirubrobacteraceae bacterium]|nr:type II toxin-antitoxin system VapC family toxin [Solirubrobacteraceae bacterium]